MEQPSGSLALEAEAYFRKLEEFKKDNDELFANKEAFIYAIAQSMQESIELFKAEPTFKGQTVQTIIDCLKDMNEFELKFWKSHINALEEQRTSTFH